MKRPCHTRVLHLDSTTFLRCSQSNKLLKKVSLVLLTWFESSNRRIDKLGLLQVLLETNPETIDSVDAVSIVKSGRICSPDGLNSV